MTRNDTPDRETSRSTRCSPQIDAIADRFEAAWLSGQHPRIEDYLQALPRAEDPRASRALLVELVMTDLEQRWRRGSVAATQPVLLRDSAPGADPGASPLPDQPRLEHYVRCYPDLGPVESLPDELIAFEYRVRQLWGDRPQHAEYLARFKGRGAEIQSDLNRIDEELQGAGRACGSKPLQPGADDKTEEHNSPESDDTEVLSPGCRLDHYLIQKCLGKGGMATVYLAHDEQLDRPVAIKVPHAACSDQQIEPFLEEARAVAKLKHPGIVPIYHFGRHPDGWCYFVMEYIEGRSLKDLLAAERPSPEQAADLLSQVAVAVHHAHKRGFMHRDLKPGNILLDNEGKPHVADFGLALHESVQRDRPGQYGGTLPYMAPEQVRGESHRLDGRTDVWALGVILYEALAGRRPFEGRGFTEVEDEILNRQPKPPRQIADDIPEHLERACLRCLSKDMTERYPTAADLARDLGGRKAPRRTLLAAGIVGAVLAAFAAVFAAWMAGRAPSALTQSGPDDEALAAVNRHGGPSTPAQPEPLAGTIDVWVWGSGDARRRVTLHDAGALPLRPGDQIRIEATLNRPAYPYLFLIDSQGVVAPVYPWTQGDWNTRPEQEAPTEQVSLPDLADQGWRVKPPYGTETLVLLARDEPLDAEVDVAGLLAGLPSQRIRDPGRAIWFAEGKPLTKAADRLRGIDLTESHTIHDSLLQTQRLIQEKLGPYFGLNRAVSFASAEDGGGE